MDGKKRAHLVERGNNMLNGGPHEIWDVGGGADVYVVYRVYAAGEAETVAYPFDMAEHVAKFEVLGCWLGNATGGKAIRELGYEPIEED